MIDLDRTQSLLDEAQAALDRGDLELAAQLSEEADADLATPLPPLRRSPPQEGTQSDLTVDWLAAAVELELSRPRYRALSRSEAAKRGAARVRASEREERAHGRTGYAFRSGLVASELERIAQEAPPKPEPIRLKPSDDGEGKLPYGWLEEAKRFPVDQVLRALGAEPVGRGGRWSPCPACGSTPGTDRRGKVLVNAKGRWHCVKCEEGGSGLDAVGWALLGRKPDGKDDLKTVGRWFAQGGV